MRESSEITPGKVRGNKLCHDSCVSWHIHAHFPHFSLIFLIFLSFSSFFSHFPDDLVCRDSFTKNEEDEREWVTTHRSRHTHSVCRDLSVVTHSRVTWRIHYSIIEFSENKEILSGKMRGKMRKMRELSGENEENEKIVSGKWENCLGKMRELSRENERIVSGQTNEIFKHKWENYLRNKEILSGKWKKTIHVTWIIHVIFFLRNNERVGQRVGHRKWAMSHE